MTRLLRNALSLPVAGTFVSLVACGKASTLTVNERSSTASKGTDRACAVRGLPSAAGIERNGILVPRLSHMITYGAADRIPALKVSLDADKYECSFSGTEFAPCVPGQTHLSEVPGSDTAADGAVTF